MMQRSDDRCRELAHLSRWARGFWFVSWGILVIASSRVVVGDDGSPVWRSDFSAAVLEAEERKLPLLVHFHADWCMPCQRMERDVLTAPNVLEIIGSRYVAVKLNSDHHPELVQRYGVASLPSDVVLDSLVGKIVNLHSGGLDQAEYLQMLLKSEAKFLNFHAASLQQTRDPDNNKLPKNSTSVTVNTEDAVLGEPQPVVGLDGYSPVAIAKHLQWTRGSARFAWVYKDVTYFMSSREELLLFRNNPESIAPKLLGCDPVILWETDRAVAGMIEFGAFFDGELFLFKTEERRQQFKANPDKYVRLQHALKINEVERTAMR